jgi:hypothetical protein
MFLFQQIGLLDLFLWINNHSKKLVYPVCLSHVSPEMIVVLEDFLILPQNDH